SHAPATPATSTLSLHDALPICGLAIAFIGGRALAALPGKGQASAAAPGFDPNVFVHVAPDGLVTLVCARSEMGQGVRSTLPALLDRKSTRLNSSHDQISYAVFC